ncbi:DUF3575 domain-containing protein [Chryseobacterium sp. Hurlbut01]|uniref:DUF3575 domain-containing protein n=1 Tax=Chryseobacterium sp. Hurlbut01 TaxID=1681828 RepID=UPI00067B643B|nr:DUF3575 domain-containing protein [Chryseobacterium sp. Hurlbut01]KNB62719.1 hypothetical protein AC804_01350 [Chryseobacterium sp. Hurlbut01]
MKKLLIIASCFYISGVYAQEISTSEVNTVPEDKMNIIKTNITGYAFRNINLSYERSINRWFAINVGFGTVTEGKVPFMNAFLSEEDEKDFQNLKIKATNFTIEPRFYIGEGYGKGFYFAPYYRYSKVSTNTFDYTYDYTAFGTTVPIPLKGLGDANGNSGGLMVGAQFFLNKQHSFVLDFWIAGAHYGSGKGNFSLTSNIILTPEMQNELKKEIENLDIPFVDYTVETNANGANIKLDGPWAGFRSGFSLGYRF